MTPEQARTLVQQMAATWNDGTWNDTAVRVWIDDLADLQEGAAGTALVKLRRTWKPAGRQTHPSIQEFYEQYKAVDTYQPPERVPCTVCEGSGWEQTTTTSETGVPYSAVAPCRCQNGRNHDETFQGIKRHNHTAA